MLPDSSQLQELVIRTAREELLPRFNRVSFQVKADNSLVTEADLASHARLKRELAERWPHIGFLSEEMPRAEQEALLKTPGPCWCLDPLDGTSNFVAGVPVFALSLALVADRPVLGMVYDPVRDECFRADQGRGAWLNDRPLETVPAVVPLERAIAIVDFKRLPLPLRLKLVEKAPYGSQRNFGSSALEWAWMAAGRGDLYLHGGQKVWDYAAGWLILSEAGGRSVTLNGDAVYAPEVTPRSVVASPDPTLFDAWVRWLSG